MLLSLISQEIPSEEILKQFYWNEENCKKLENQLAHEKEATKRVKAKNLELKQENERVKKELENHQSDVKKTMIDTKNQEKLMAELEKMKKEAPRIKKVNEEEKIGYKIRKFFSRIFSN